MIKNTLPGQATAAHSFATSDTSSPRPQSTLETRGHKIQTRKNWPTSKNAHTPRSESTPGFVDVAKLKASFPQDIRRVETDVSKPKPNRGMTPLDPANANKPKPNRRMRPLDPYVGNRNVPDLKVAVLTPKAGDQRTNQHEEFLKEHKEILKNLAAKENPKQAESIPSNPDTQRERPSLEAVPASTRSGANNAATYPARRPQARTKVEDAQERFGGSKTTGKQSPNALQEYMKEVAAKKQAQPGEVQLARLTAKERQVMLDELKLACEAAEKKPAIEQGSSAAGTSETIAMMHYDLAIPQSSVPGKHN